VPTKWVQGAPLLWARWSTSPTIVSGSRRRSHRRRTWVGAGILSALLGLCMGSTACNPDCSPIPHDNFYPLDTRLDAGASPDARSSGDASPDARPDGAVAVDASPPPDAGATADAGWWPDGSIRPMDAAPYRPNCGSLAEGCTAGQPCPAACDCVITREGMTRDTDIIIDSCILAAGTAVPSVEVRSRLVVHCE